MSTKTKKLVTTIHGEELDINLCRKFNKLYYKIGDVDVEHSGDCYQIEDKMYRYETGALIYNYSIKKYVLKASCSLMLAVVYFKNGHPIIGHVNFFQPDYALSIKGLVYPVFDEEGLLNCKKYKEQLSTGVFYRIDELTAVEFKALRVPDVNYKTSLPYDSKGVLNQHIKLFEEKFKDNLSYSATEYSKILQGLTFGFEFETSMGYLPARITEKYGLIPLRDGSIQGIEYVTVPMSGAKGLQSTINCLKELRQRTSFDNSCSMHLHLGNIPRTPSFLLAFTKFILAYQDEMFSMFPLVKKYNFKMKNKNYSSPFPTYDILSQLDPVITATNLNKNFNVLFRYLSQGESFSDYSNSLDNVKVHPSDPNANQKWNIRTRYHIVNLIPIIFGNKQTIEFRIHTPTYDEQKIVNFLFMNAAIVNYVISNQKRILEDPRFLLDYKLKNAVDNSIRSSGIKNSGYLASNLLEYMKYRTFSTEDQNRQGKISGEESHIFCEKVIDWESTEDQLSSRSLEDLIATKPTLKRREGNLAQASKVLTGSDTYSENPPVFNNMIDYDTFVKNKAKEVLEKQKSFQTKSASSFQKANDDLDDYFKKLHAEINSSGFNKSSSVSGVAGTSGSSSPFGSEEAKGWYEKVIEDVQVKNEELKNQQEW